MKVTLNVPRSILEYMNNSGVPVREQADLFERFVAYSTGMMTGDEENLFDEYISDHESEYTAESISNPIFWQSLNESKNSLKDLVGKEDDEDLDLDDARKIGKMVSKMVGEDRKKYVGIINFMGASCRIYNEIWANYKPVDPEKKNSNKGKAFRGEKPEA